MSRNEIVKFGDLVGKTLREVNVGGNSDITFVVDDKESYCMYHSQDCCENVWIEDICGDTNDLIGKTILFADESSSDESDKGLRWTFYRIGTFNGTVVIRWCADTETYYSVQVDFGRN